MTTLFRLTTPRPEVGPKYPVEPFHPMAQFIARFKERPEVRAIILRFEFTPVATVETKDVKFAEARGWALALDYSRKLQGRVRPHRHCPERDDALWEFELEEDAILFACKFGGTIRALTSSRPS